MTIILSDTNCLAVKATQNKSNQIVYKERYEGWTEIIITFLM